MNQRIQARCTAVLLASVLLLAGAAPTAGAQDADAATRQRVYYEAKPAVVLIWASAHARISVAAPSSPADGTLVPDGGLLLDLEAVVATSGSGWLITPDGYLVTNGHVIQLFHEANEERLQAELFYGALEEAGYFRHPAIVRAHGGGAVELPHDTRLRLMQRLLPYADIRIAKNLNVYTQNWRRYPAEVKEYSPPIFPFEGRASVPGLTLATGKDVAILKIEGRDLPTLTIGDSEAMRIGENVHVAGYPMATRSISASELNPQTEMEASFTRGQVSSVKLDVKGSTVLQYDAATSFGHSGGPLLNDRGEVVGMATMGAEPGFFFAVPSSVVTEFIRSAGVVPARGIFDHAWAEALDLYFGGGYARAVPAFDHALRIMPELRDANELRREAMVRSSAAPVPASSSMPWVFGAAGLAGLTLLAAGVAVRRRRAEPTPARPGGAAGHLVVRAGPLEGNRFPIPTDGVRIGRDAGTCQVVISESTVSREHAIVLPTSARGEFLLRNLSGTNPTFVNERAVQEATLTRGDLIKIGNSLIDVE